MKNNAIIENAYPFGSYLMYKIPISELEIDHEYQRLETVTVGSLVRKWKGEKCDPLLVNYRPSEDKFYVIDGGHRLAAARILQLELLPCRILVNKTKKEEAELYYTQDNEVEALKVFDVYKAALVAEDASAMRLKSILDKYNIRVVRNPYNTAETIRCLAVVWRMVKQNNIEALEWILDVIKKSDWHFVPGAYNKTIVESLYKSYMSFADHVKTKKIVADYIKNFSPSQLKTAACSEYPWASPISAISTHMTNYITNSLKKEKNKPVIAFQTITEETL